jgi:PKD repeat protein
LPLTAHAIALVGSGRDAGGSLLAFEGGNLKLGFGSSVSNVALSTASFPVLEIGAGASAETIRASTSHTSGFLVGLSPHGSESTLRNAILTLPTGGSDSGTGVVANTSVGGGIALASDVEVTAPTGIELDGEVGKGQSVLQRAIARGGRCLAANATNFVSDLLCLPASTTAPAISVFGDLDLRQATVIGSGPIGLETVGSSGARTATVHGSIVRGFAADFQTNTGGTIAVDTSDFHNAVAVTPGAGNVDLEPQFLNSGGGDYRLGPSSPLVGLAGTLPIQPNESPTDVGGRPRIVGGKRDMGAFERQPIQPSITASPNPVSVGQAVTFSAAGSSYLEGPISSYQWDLEGNGSFATSTGVTPTVIHTYTTPGAVTVTVRVSASDGSVATQSVVLNVIQALAPVAAPPTATIATISHLSETNKTFAPTQTSTPLSGQTASRRRSKRHPRGTTFSFALDQIAAVAVKIEREDSGRRVGHTCKASSKRLRHRPKCTRYSTVATLARQGHAGINRVGFTGRIRGGALKPGRYRAVFTATDAAGTSAPRTITFTIVAQ